MNDFVLTLLKLYQNNNAKLVILLGDCYIQMNIDSQNATGNVLSINMVGKIKKAQMGRSNEKCFLTFSEEYQNIFP